MKGVPSLRTKVLCTIIGLLTVGGEASLQKTESIIELPINRVFAPHRRFLQGQQSNFSSVSVLEHGVQNHENYAYSTTLYVGSHLQPLNLLLDSGSSIMWLQSEECPNPSQCHGESPYRESESTTFQQLELTQSIQYGIGKVLGHVVTDSISWVANPMTS